MTKPVLPPDLAETLDPATILVRGGATRSPYDETCEALFMTSGFVYGTAAAAERTACKSSHRLAKCRYAALGTTPARLVASRSTTASGPPARASWIPASSSARRRSPWRYVLRSGGLASVTILYVDTVHLACYSIVDGVHQAVYPNPRRSSDAGPTLFELQWAL